MLMRVFVSPLLGAIYASGWWAFALFDFPIHPLVLVGISYIGLVVYLGIAVEIKL